ncbi:MAG: MarR family transcriptional regulator [Spirochaetales bacterium]|nr:MarR family transcriptional regulator [Candidatus Physcosoma equi]
MSYPKDLHDKTLEEQLSLLLRGCGHFLFLQTSRGSSQLSVLHLLKTEGPLSQKDLAEKLNVKPASVSELVTKLERKGLLERQRTEEDRRKVVLCLTEKGRSVPELKKEDKAHYYDALSKEEKTALASSLKKLMRSWIEESEK